MAEKLAEKNAPEIEPVAHRHPAAPEPAKVVRISPKPVIERNIQPLEFKQSQWHVLVNDDVLPEDCLRREFWGQVAPNRFAPGHKVVIFAEDRSWYGEMLVWGVGIGWAEMRFLFPPVIKPSALAGHTAAADYETRDLGEIRKWGIVRKTDGAIVHSGELTPDAAARWLAEYLKSQMGRAA